VNATTQTSLPDFNQPGLTWFNVEKPLGLSDVFGRILILDFWTFSCINCLHILPSLRRIERAFEDDVIILGIHSPNFPYERDVQNVQKAIQRYQIEHPVVHDPEFKLWDAYQAKVWPTLILVSPDGQIFARQAGEPDADKLLEAVGNAVRKYKAKGKLRPAKIETTPQPKQAQTLRFPGKIKKFSWRGAPHWAIADTGHHQIAIADDNGKIIQRIGRGSQGNLDGEFTRAAFDNPYGLAAAEDKIYIGDLGSHLIRQIDLSKKTVTTIAGTSRRGLTLGKPVPAREAGVASVFDLEIIGQELFFTNTGTHQIGAIDLDTMQLRAIGGGGQKDLQDGTGKTAKLAQPSGLAYFAEQNRLYFADSDNSAIRYVDLADGNAIKTLVGRGMAQSGRRNGPFTAAKLQHPMGIARLGDFLIAADSFNATLRKLDLKRNVTENFAEDFKPITDNLPPLLDPEGIAWDGGNRLLVTDCNQHRILVYDLAAKTWGVWLG
jgi:thiol-disulfide isomerase/thioredoxin